MDIVAREAGIPLDLVWVDLRARKLKDGSSYLRINPKGQVPTLQTDDGQLLTEGSVIMQYLADARPGCGLLPPSLGIDRYRVLEWLSFLGSELHKSFTPLFRPTTPDAYRVIATENLRRRLAWLDEVLGQRAYLHGDSFTVADAYCYTVVMWSRLHQIELADWPRLNAYLERIALRPSVQAAQAAEHAAEHAAEDAELSARSAALPEPSRP